VALNSGKWAKDTIKERASPKRCYVRITVLVLKYEALSLSFV
jgi:hypothetical protein